VQLTHRNCWLNAAMFGWHVAVTDRDVYMHTLPMFHCNGWGMPYAVTAMGVPQVVVRKIDGEEILRRMETHGVTLLCGAPAVVAAVLDAGTPPGGREGRRCPVGIGSASSSPGRRPHRRPSNGSRPSWGGSSSRSMG
jgi:fatty-acyl-CoA synthase